MRVRNVWWLFWICAIGCGDDGANPQPDAANQDSATSDANVPIEDARVDSAQATDAAHDSALPTLPSCTLACDRVIDCAAVTCIGVDWRTARLAQLLCDEACGADSALSANVMTANDCPAVMTLIETASPALDMLCNASPCASACQQFAECTRAQCERYAAQTEAEIAAGCMSWCQDENAGDILGVSCDVLISALETNDPNFAAGCHELGCADMPTCVAYADKTTACMLDNCAGNADAYELGIQQVLVDYCATADDCPAPGTVAMWNEQAVTCSDPPFNAVGPAAPFTSICAGTVGADHADLIAACDTLVDCGAAFASVDLCATFLALEAGAAAKATCIDAANDCPGAFACL